MDISEEEKTSVFKSKFEDELCSLLEYATEN